MTELVSRLPLGLAPLIAEARRRMRRRRSLVALVLALGGLAVGLTFALPSPSAGPGVPHPLTSSVGAAGLKISIPQGFSRLPLHGSFGHRQHGVIRWDPPVGGWIIADFNPKDAFGNWQLPAGPPANVVAFEFDLYQAIGPAPSSNLHLPLTLKQPWIEEKLANGAAGYRYGFFLFHDEPYEVMYWSGPNAPASDRRAILRALESIRPALK